MVVATLDGAEEAGMRRNWGLAVFVVALFALAVVWFVAVALGW